MATARLPGPAGTIQVGIRCRPLDSKERASNERTIFAHDQEANAVLLEHPRLVDQPPRSFGFQHVFPPESTQKDVYNSMCSAMVPSALDGYHSTFFAYGQTGSGKTYSMTGLPGEEGRGVTPRLLAELFAEADRLNAAAGRAAVRVDLSYLELYNERLRDLLVPTPPGAGPLAGDPRDPKLEVKEHPVLGTFVSNATEAGVKTLGEAEELLRRGARERHTRATAMNESSSRSHSVVVLRVRRDPERTLAKIYLVDLAGSERQSKTGATGDALKEAASINKSLSTLGRVITTLVQNQRKGRRERVPYPDSLLTRLLKEALGGNSRTSMLATISPAGYNYEESLSTLNYAFQASQIVTHARRNLSEDAKELSKLRAEVEDLRARLRDAAQVPALDREREVAALRERLEQREYELRQNSEERARLLLEQRQLGALVADAAAALRAAGQAAAADQLARLGAALERAVAGHEAAQRALDAAATATARAADRLAVVSAEDLESALASAGALAEFSHALEGHAAALEAAAAAKAAALAAAVALADWAPPAGAGPLAEGVRAQAVARAGELAGPPRCDERPAAPAALAALKEFLARAARERVGAAPVVDAAAFAALAAEQAAPAAYGSVVGNAAAAAAGQAAILRAACATARTGESLARGGAKAAMQRSANEAAGAGAALERALLELEAAREAAAGLEARARAAEEAAEGLQAETAYLQAELDERTREAGDAQVQADAAEGRARAAEEAAREAGRRAGEAETAAKAREEERRQLAEELAAKGAERSEELRMAGAKIAELVARCRSLEGECDRFQAAALAATEGGNTAAAAAARAAAEEVAAFRTRLARAELAEGQQREELAALRRLLGAEIVARFGEAAGRSATASALRAAGQAAGEPPVAELWRWYCREAALSIALLKRAQDRAKAAEAGREEEAKGRAQLRARVQEAESSVEGLRAALEEAARERSAAALEARRAEAALLAALEQAAVAAGLAGVAVPAAGPGEGGVEGAAGRLEAALGALTRQLAGARRLGGLATAHSAGTGTDAPAADDELERGREERRRLEAELLPLRHLADELRAALAADGSRPPPAPEEVAPRALAAIRAAAGAAALAGEKQRATAELAAALEALRRAEAEAGALRARLAEGTGEAPVGNARHAVEAAAQLALERTRLAEELAAARGEADRWRELKRAGDEELAAAEAALLARRGASPAPSEAEGRELAEARAALAAAAREQRNAAAQLDAEVERRAALERGVRRAEAEAGRARGDAEGALERLAALLSEAACMVQRCEAVAGPAATAMARLEPALLVQLSDADFAAMFGAFGDGVLGRWRALESERELLRATFEAQAADTADGLRALAGLLADAGGSEADGAAPAPGASPGEVARRIRAAYAERLRQGRAGDVGGVFDAVAEEFQGLRARHEAAVARVRELEDALAALTLAASGPAAGAPYGPPPPPASLAPYLPPPLAPRPAFAPQPPAAPAAPPFQQTYPPQRAPPMQAAPVPWAPPAGRPGPVVAAPAVAQPYERRPSGPAALGGGSATARPAAGGSQACLVQ